MAVDFPDELRAHARGRFWGITPEGVLLYTNTTVSEADDSWSGLRRYYDLLVYVTNHEVGWERYKSALGELVDEWIQPTTRHLAEHATPETAQQFVLGAAYEAEGGVMRLLRTAQEYDDEDDGTIVVPRRDAFAVAEEQEIDLLRSFGVLRSTRNGFRFDQSVIRKLHGSRELSQAEACWAILSRICDAHGVQDSEAVIPTLLENLGVDPPESAPPSMGSLPIYAGDPRVAGFVHDLFDEATHEVFDKIARMQSNRAERLHRTTGIGYAEPTVENIEWPVSDRSAAVCAVASQQGFPVASGWIIENESAADRFALRRTLDSAGFDVALDEELLRFLEAYDGPTDPEAVSAYEDYVSTERDRARSIATAAQLLSDPLEDSWKTQQDGLLAAAMTRLDDVTTAPIEFVFSMFDPVYHADEYEIEEYVGESQHLDDEVDQIREWRMQQPHDAVTFAEKVRELCARPIEDDSVAPRLRVMSPWMNFTIQEYTALFQRLLENDVRVQLLIRLPDPSDWNNLKRNFLSRLGDTHGNLELRTYTRYKRFKDHTQLRKHKRGELDDQGDSFVSETGVHAKLYVAGNSEGGAALAGSANLMENSFYYNPEAGLHTRHPEVIQTAIDYYDLIWSIAKPDRIDESVFTGKTNFEFYPRVYRP